MVCRVVRDVDGCGVVTDGGDGCGVVTDGSDGSYCPLRLHSD